jgi:ABC-type cobalamin transport system ATPase subunit
LVFDDGERGDPQDWQLEVVADMFRGFRETWLIVPEGNGKSTLLAELALYGADFSGRRGFRSVRRRRSRPGSFMTRRRGSLSGRRA